MTTPRQAVDKVAIWQDRLNTLIEFLMSLPELPGDWSVSATAYPSVHCRVKDMDDWKVVRGHFGSAIRGKRVNTVQQLNGAIRSWTYDMVGRDDGLMVFIALDPGIRGSTCELIPVGMDEVVRYEVKCR